MAAVASIAVFVTQLAAGYGPLRSTDPTFSKIPGFLIS